MVRKCKLFSLIVCSLSLLALSACELGGGNGVAPGAGGSGDTGNGNNSNNGGNNPSAPSLVGTWLGPCNDAGPISSPVRASQVSLNFGGSGALDLITTFYSDSTCTTETAFYAVVAAYVVGAQTSAPANGWVVTTALAASTANWINAETSAAGTAINGDCGVTIFSGVFPDSVYENAMTCPGDSRFDLQNDSTVGQFAVVYNTTSISTTSMLPNFPGVLNGATLDSSTSLTFDLH